MLPCSAGGMALWRELRVSRPLWEVWTGTHSVGGPDCIVTPGLKVTCIQVLMDVLLVPCCIIYIA